MFLFVNCAPRQQEVKQVDGLDLTVSVEVWTEAVLAAAVVERREVVVVVRRGVSATQPHTRSCVERRRWVVVRCRWVCATRIVYVHLCNAHGSDFTSLLHPVDSPVWS